MGVDVVVQLRCLRSEHAADVGAVWLGDGQRNGDLRSTARWTTNDELARKVEYEDRLGLHEWNGRLTAATGGVHEGIHFRQGQHDA
jgi:hypothetical protein